MAIFFDAHQQSCFAALFPAMPSPLGARNCSYFALDDVISEDFSDGCTFSASKECSPCARARAKVMYAVKVS